MIRITSYTPEALTQIANESISVLIHKFSCLISNGQNDDLYCFVEGHDLPYYNSRIEAISGRRCVFIDSKGKKNVIKACCYFNNQPNYANYTKLYFVDHDYDDNSNLDSAIYVTPCYSVENLCVSNVSFAKMMKGVYNVDVDNPKYELVMTFFETEKNKMLSATKTFCAWYKCVRNMQGENHVELSESFPADISVIGPDYIMEVNNNLEYINAKYPNIPNVGSVELDASLQEINNNLINIRGKYVFEFIEYITCVLNKDVKGQKKYTEGKATFEKNRKTLLSRLSPYAETPTSLRDYVFRMTS